MARKRAINGWSFVAAASGLAVLGSSALAAEESVAPAVPEARFQFDQRGTPSIHTYLLKWSPDGANLQSIDVLVSETKEVIQTIPVPQDQVQIVWQNLQGREANVLKDKVIEAIDYNFDRLLDLRLTRLWPYKVGTKSYMIWLFDPDKNQYVFAEELSSLTGAVPNPFTRLIEATTLGGLGGYEYDKRVYSITAEGRLTVQTKISQKVVDERQALFSRDVRVRTGGALERICKILVPAEGKPRRTWGRAETCRPYLEKNLWNEPPTAASSTAVAH